MSGVELTANLGPVTTQACDVPAQLSGGLGYLLNLTSSVSCACPGTRTWVTCKRTKVFLESEQLFGPVCDFRYPAA